MRRALRCTFVVSLTVCATFVAAVAVAAHGRSALIDRAVAAQLGLERAWFTQVALDSAYSQANDWAISGDELFVSTSVGVIHAIDVNTGRTLWTTRVGNPDHPTLGPTVADEFVAVINGSTAYLLNRVTGRVAWEKSLDGAPGAPPAVADGYVYAPLLNGRVVGYAVDESRAKYPWHYQSFGRAMVAPLATPDGLIWSTDRGYLYATGGEQPAIRYRLETPGTFTTSAKMSNDMVYTVSSLGELYAIDPARGGQMWKYSTGFASYQPPAVIEGDVYVASVEPALHAVDTDSGDAKWHVRGISQFAAVTASRVYGIDRFGTLTVLDRASGARLARVSTDAALSAVPNDQSDRLILITESGLVQCFHELGADEPKYYVSKPGVMADDALEDDELAADRMADDDAADDDAADDDAADDDAADDDADDESVDDDFGGGFDGGFGAESEDATDDGESDEDDPFGGFGDFGDENPF
jgi:outer membrane protein assembly factor BamB